MSDTCTKILIYLIWEIFWKISSLYFFSGAMYIMNLMLNFPTYALLLVLGWHKLSHGFSYSCIILSAWFLCVSTDPNVDISWPTNATARLVARRRIQAGTRKVLMTGKLWGWRLFVLFVVIWSMCLEHQNLHIGFVYHSSLAAWAENN